MSLPFIVHRVFLSFCFCQICSSTIAKSCVSQLIQLIYTTARSILTRFTVLWWFIWPKQAIWSTVDLPCWMFCLFCSKILTRAKLDTNRMLEYSFLMFMQGNFLDATSGDSPLASNFHVKVCSSLQLYKFSSPRFVS